MNWPDQIENERRYRIAVARTMHGHRSAEKGTPERQTWVAWCSMRQRCEDSNYADFRRYGGRGITVCLEWHDYLRFLADVGLVPAAGMTLERKNNALGYCKENCRWATRQEQARNRRSNRLLCINGEQKTLAEWAELSGVNSSTIRMRITHGDAIDGSLLRRVS